MELGPLRALVRHVQTAFCMRDPDERPPDERPVPRPSSVVVPSMSVPPLHRAVEQLKEFIYNSPPHARQPLVDVLMLLQSGMADADQGAKVDAVHELARLELLTTVEAACFDCTYDVCVLDKTAGHSRV